MRRTSLSFVQCMYGYCTVHWGIDAWFLGMGAKHREALVGTLLVFCVQDLWVLGWWEAKINKIVIYCEMWVLFCRTCLCCALILKHCSYCF
jgi:hypothetical protein